jgi:hypothetical protein
MNHCRIDARHGCAPLSGARTGGTQGSARQGTAQWLMDLFWGGAQQQRPLEGLVVCFEHRADEAESREGGHGGCVGERVTWSDGWSDEAL